MWPFNRHKHDWKPTKILQGELKWLGKFGKPVSQIYYYCAECKEGKMEQRDGWWEPEDFGGISESD